MRRRVPSGNAWSTAFCMSSLRTTASGVATSPGSSPASPSTWKRIVCSAEDAVSSTRRASGRTISLKATTSPASRESVSWTIAIDRMRRSDSASAARASGELQPTALEPQQRRDRLQVVLHAVVDLADRRVLRQQQPVAAAEVADVAQRARARRPGRRRPSSGSTRTSTDTSSCSISSATGRCELHRAAGRRVVEADVGESLRLRVRVDAHAVQRAHCVRARELHPRLGVDHDHAVADARGALHLDLVDVERERAVGDHAREAVETSGSRCARAHPSGGRASSAPRVTRARSAGPRRRPGYTCTRTRSFDPSAAVSAAHDVTRAPAARDERALHLVDDGADEVLRVVRLAGDRAHLGRGRRSDGPPRR